MTSNIVQYLNYVIDNYEVEFSSKVLEKTVFTYLIDFSKGQNSGKHIANILGDLAYLYSYKNIEDNEVKEFIRDISKCFPYVDKFLATHISNFMEIVLVNRTSCIKDYISCVNDNFNIEDEDNTAILYSAIVRGVMKDNMNIHNVFEKIEYKWRCYYEICNYYYYYGQNIKALKYIKKAEAESPLFLKVDYKNKEKVMQGTV